MEDPTLSNASPLLALIEAIRDGMSAGGPVVVLLCLMSIAALAIVIAKTWQFAAVRVGDRRTAEHGLTLLRGRRDLDALAHVEASGNPTAQALALAIRGKRRGVPEVKVREEVQCFCQARLSTLRGWLKPLEVIAALAPLLGLLGTVLGMIEAFRRLEEAGRQVDPAILSGGIWEALLTTAVGLAVAIPAVIASTWFEQRLERLADDMETMVPRVFTEDLSAHPLTEQEHGAAVAPIPGGA